MKSQTLQENSTNFLTALFKDPSNAEEAYNNLLEKGYKEEDITLIMSNDTHKKYFLNQSLNDPSTTSSKTMEGMGVGGAIGGTVGAIAAALAAAGTSFVIPGLGIVVAGSLAAAFAGAGAGAAAGGLVGALIGSGIPEVEAKEYEKGVQDGGVVLGVTPLTSADFTTLKNEWKKYKAQYSSK